MVKERILNFFDSIVLVFLEPEKYFQKILEDEKTRKGLYFLIFFAAFLGFMTGALLNNLILAVILAVIYIILAFIKVFIWAGISHLIARYLFQGEGKFTALFGLFGFSSVSYLWGILGLALFMVSGKLFFTALVLCLLMAVWMIVLLTIALEKEHQVGYGRAFLSVMGIPALIISVIGLIMGVL